VRDTSTLAVSTLVPVATTADERLEVLGLTDGTSSLNSGSSSLTGTSGLLSTNLLGGFSSTPLASNSSTSTFTFTFTSTSSSPCACAKGRSQATERRHNR
jgi:hypothetical protein